MVAMVQFSGFVKKIGCTVFDFMKNSNQLSLSWKSYSMSTIVIPCFNSNFSGLVSLPK
jgi:hypothetical protein